MFNELFESVESLHYSQGLTWATSEVKVVTKPMVPPLDFSFFMGKKYDWKNADKLTIHSGFGDWKVSNVYFEKEDNIEVLLDGRCRFTFRMGLEASKLD